MIYVIKQPSIGKNYVIYVIKQSLEKTIRYMLSNNHLKETIWYMLLKNHP